MYREKALLFFSRYYEWGIGLLAGILVFRKPATIAIIVFVALHLLFFRRLKWRREALWSVVLISLPFLLDLIFLWNNDDLGEGFKHMEKRVSLLLFPVLLLFQKQSFDIRKILSIYGTCFSIILTGLFIRYSIVESELFFKYIDGVHLWEMGYSFANSMGLHAPAVNMHVAFLVIVNTFLLVTSFRASHRRFILAKFICLLLSVFFLLYLNTRIAVVIACIGILVIVVTESARFMRLKPMIIASGISAVAIVVFLFAFAKANPYMVEKYTTNTFGNLDMVGRLDEFKNPEAEVFSSLVTRVSIWKTAFERAQEDIWIGVGAADGKRELTEAYKNTNQMFLYKYKFPTHNQYLDFLLKFGILGLVAVLAYMLHILWLAYKLRSSLVLMFFILFFVCNLTDDFLIRFDGITFSALWISLFAGYYWINRSNKDPQAIESF